MGFLSKLEGKMEDTFEGTANRMANTPISPVQIAKQAEKEMRREKIVGAGKQYAPTLYTILVNPSDDRRLFGYYPTLAGETETYLKAKAIEHGYVMDGQPLVRFVIDGNLKSGKFDVIAEPVAAPIIAQLRKEEFQRYGITGSPYEQQAPQYHQYSYNAPQNNYYEDRGYEDDFDHSLYGDSSANAAAPLAAANTALFSPATKTSSPQGARLIDTKNNRSHSLKAPRIVLGRDSENDVVLQDLNASRVHAEINLDYQGIWVLTDLGSTNGTCVNERPVASHPLHEGDRISIGLTTLVFTQA